MACYSKLIPPPSPSLLPLFSPSLPHIHVCVVCVCACIFSLEVNILKTLIFRRGKVLDLKKKSRISVVVYWLLSTFTKCVGDVGSIPRPGKFHM